MRRTDPKRRAAERRGRRAEAWAALRLRLCFYRILARQWRSRFGELDLVARRGNIVAVIEVKSRPDAVQAMAAVSPTQQRRLCRAAQQFLATRPDLAGCDVRFDVMLITPWRLPRHIKAAFLCAE